MPSLQHELKDLCIIIAAKNETHCINACLASVHHYLKWGVDIICVDDGSTDDTRAKMQNFEGVQILDGGGLGPANARNQAVQLTHKPLVAFIDADAEAEPGWLENLLTTMNDAHESVAAVGGPQLVSNLADSQEKDCITFLELLGDQSDYIHTSNRVMKVDHNPTCNVLYKKRDIEAVNGFDVQLWPCEDLDLDLRLRASGKEFLFNPDAKVEHRRVGSFLALMRMLKRYGRGHSGIFRKHGFCQRIHILMLGFLLSFVTLSALALSLGAFYLMGLYFFLWVVGIAFFRMRGQSMPKAAKFSVWLYAGLFNWLSGFFVGILTERAIARHGEKAIRHYSSI